MYLGQRVSQVETDMENEIRGEFRKVGKVSTIINRPKSNIPNSLKKKLYNECVLPAMTWTLTKALERRLAAAQRNMETAMIGVSW